MIDGKYTPDEEEVILKDVKCSRCHDSVMVKMGVESGRVYAVIVYIMILMIVFSLAILFLVELKDIPAENVFNFKEDLMKTILLIFL